MTVDDWTTGTDALMFSECVHCSNRWYLPHDRCPNCGAAEHRRLPSAGSGVVAAVAAMPAASGGRAGAPYGICLVDLDDRVRVMGRVALTVDVGTRVEVLWEEHQPMFVPTAAVRRGTRHRLGGEE